MSAQDHAKALNTLLKSVKSKYDPAELAERTPLEELVYSMLLWEAPASKADGAYKRIVASMVDFNELRVTRSPELVALMGKTYPRVEERAARLRAALNELFLREYAVTLDPCAAMSKRDARKYLESLEGCPQYVAARVLLLRMDGHAIPVDDRLNYRLMEAGVTEEDADCSKTAGVLERHVKAEDARAVHLLLQSWSEDPATEPKKARQRPRVEYRPPEPKPKPPVEVKDLKPSTRKSPSIKPKSKQTGKSARA